MKKIKWHAGLRCAIVGVVLYTCTIVSGSPITRMDIFDAADNQLLFVTFEYNDAGACIKRNVFTSDSTFLYSTTLQPGSSTDSKKEVSVDYIDNTLYTATISAPSNGTTNFSTVDQFGLTQYGSPLSYAEASPNTFTISQNNAKLVSEQYEYDPDGQLSRITILDKNGAKAWYAQVITSNVAVNRPIHLSSLNLLQVSVNRGTIRLQCTMGAEQIVSAELLTTDGRCVRSLVNKSVPKGAHTFSVPTGGFLASGVYIVRVTINGTAALNRRVIVQK